MKRRQALISAIAALPLATQAGQAQAPQPKKRSFEQYVTDKLDEIDSLLGPDGMQAQLADVTAKLTKIENGMSECDAETGDPSDIVAVRNTLDEIKKILGIP